MFSTMKNMYPCDKDTKEAPPLNIIKVTLLKNWSLQVCWVTACRLFKQITSSTNISF